MTLFMLEHTMNTHCAHHASQSFKSFNLQWLGHGIFNMHISVAKSSFLLSCDPLKNEALSLILMYLLLLCAIGCLTKLMDFLFY